MRIWQEWPRAVLTLVLAAVGCAIAVAQDRPVPDWVNRITVSGRAYLRFGYELGESRNDYNEFAIERIYLMLLSKVSDKSFAQYTLEGGEIRDADYRLSGGNLEKTSTSMDVETTYFYFELNEALYRRPASFEWAKHRSPGCLIKRICGAIACIARSSRIARGT